jgi:hypothetical protein
MKQIGYNLCYVYNFTILLLTQFFSFRILSTFSNSLHAPTTGDMSGAASFMVMKQML